MESLREAIRTHEAQQVVDLKRQRVYTAMDTAFRTLFLTFLSPAPHGDGCPHLVANPPSASEWYEQLVRLIDAIYPVDLQDLSMPHTPWQIVDNVGPFYDPFGDGLVLVLTPMKTYEFQRSRYGENRLNGTTSAPSTSTAEFRRAWKELTGKDFVVESVEVEEELEEESDGDEEEQDSDGC